MISVLFGDKLQPIASGKAIYGVQLLLRGNVVTAVVCTCLCF